MLGLDVRVSHVEAMHVSNCLGELQQEVHLVDPVPSRPILMGHQSIAVMLENQCANRIAPKNIKQVR